MPDPDNREDSPMETVPSLPVAPSLEPALEALQVPPKYSVVDERVALISGISIFVGAGAAVIAGLLAKLIGLITNVAYFGRWSTAFSSWVIPKT